MSLQKKKIIKTVCNNMANEIKDKLSQNLFHLNIFKVTLALGVKTVYKMTFLVY